MTILSGENCNKLRAYVYKGTCDSPVYNHGLTHVANFFVAMVPTWVAPNVITSLGMLPMAFAAAIALWKDPWLTGNPVSWYPLLLAAAVFTYQTADNMDGKQARKVGASSGLGMLFDHVCDSMNSGVLGLCMGSLFGCGWEVVFWATLLFAYVPFYVQTWEEYYLKEMVFPFISGPVEGLLLIILFSFVTYAYGVQWWWEEGSLSERFPLIPWEAMGVPDEYTPFQNFAVFVVTAGLCTVVPQLYTVAKINEFRLSAPFLSLVPNLVFAVSASVWKYNSAVATQQHPLLTYILVSAVFVEHVTHLMLQLIVDDTVRPFERYLSWMMIGMAVNVVFTPYGQPLVDERLLLIPYCITAVTVTAIYLHMICVECANALDIYVFRLGKKSAKKLA